MKKWQKAVLLSSLALGAVACGKERDDVKKYVVTDKADNVIVYRGLGADTVARVMIFSEYGELYDCLMPGDTIAGAYLDDGYCVSELLPNTYNINCVNGQRIRNFIYERRDMMARDSIVNSIRAKQR